MRPHALKVAEGHNSIKAAGPSQVTEPVVKIKLKPRSGASDQLLCQVRTFLKKPTLEKWLFEITWLKYDCVKSDCVKSIVSRSTLGGGVRMGRLASTSKTNCPRLLLAQAGVSACYDLRGERMQFQENGRLACREWLYDVTWLEYDERRLVHWSTRDLAAECLKKGNWSFRYFDDDFQDKLLLVPSRTSSEG